MDDLNADGHNGLASNSDVISVTSPAIEITDFEETATEVREFVSPSDDDALPPMGNPLRHPIVAFIWLVRLLITGIILVLLLAAVSAIPIVNFAALGYLLEVEGRMARHGKFRFAVPLFDLIPRLGTIILGVWLWLLPLRFFAGRAVDAKIINPNSPAAPFWESFTVVSAVFVGVHLCLALARGGSLGCFIRPIKNVRWFIRQMRHGNYLELAESRFRDVAGRLRLKHHFWLGIRGFLGAAIWLVLPTIFFAGGETTGTRLLSTFVGGIGLMLVFSWLPFLQARFAAENRFRAILELRAIRALFLQAPLAWTLAVFVVCTLSLPLYLLKVALLPDDAMWLATIVFIISIYPAKIVVGWAYHRAASKDQKAWFGWRWIARVLLFSTVGLYVFLLFFTQFISEHGKGVLFEHHGFLLPVPFFLSPTG